MSPILPAPEYQNTNVSQEESGNLQLYCIDQKCEELCLVPERTEKQIFNFFTISRLVNEFGIRHRLSQSKPGFSV